MALDGFSLSQVGLGQDKTSAQMAINTEHDIRQSLSMKGVDQIANTDSEKAVTLDEEKEKEKSQKRKNGSSDSNEDEESKQDEAYTVDIDSKDSEIVDLDFYTKFANKLGIRLNNFSEVIELYNKETNKTVESITTVDLIKLVDKLKISSGVLVNKKI